MEQREGVEVEPRLARRHQVHSLLRKQRAHVQWTLRPEHSPLTERNSQFPRLSPSARVAPVTIGENGETHEFERFAHFLFKFEAATSSSSLFPPSKVCSAPRQGAAKGCSHAPRAEHASSFRGAGGGAATLSSP